MSPLPEIFDQWFAQRNWQLRQHQADMLACAVAGRDVLLIAPTGGGKTLAGFLPSLVALHAQPHSGLHTLYISPLKALTTDIARNLAEPVDEMGLKIRFETRTGDTPSNRRQRIRKNPPHLLLTTPESLALLLSYEDAATFFAGLQCVILDELHAIAESKRGTLLALGMARLRRLAPRARFVGLSATVAEPQTLLRFLSPTPERAEVVIGEAGAAPEVELCLPDAYMPWSGHIALYAMPTVLRRIAGVRMALVFVNTRAQAEIIFGELWRLNKDNLPIALHHGSLAVEQRRKVEAAMAKGALRAVVCTSSLDLGIDWGDVDLVIQIGAPKGVSRLLQRIGRANHRLDEPSQAMVVPANRFEVLECLAAQAALDAGTLDGGLPLPGGLDVLAQHLMGVACAGPFDAEAIFEEVSWTLPFADLPRDDFDAVLEFVATGGYALQTYERYRRLELGEDGLYRLSDRRMVQRYRMNVGTIVELPVMKVRLGRGPSLGEIEEYFVSMLTPGDTFQFAGRLLQFQGIRNNEVVVSIPKKPGDPRVPAYGGGRFSMSSHLADRVRALLSEEAAWPTLPGQVQEWLGQQVRRSVPVDGEGMLVETFPRGDRWYLVAYGFAGRNAHQTLGMLLTRRLERAGCRPQGFVASDYCIATWSAHDVDDVEALFDVDMLGDDLESWMADSSMIKRIFRNCAVVAGLIERRYPGQEKTGRQVTFNADLIYDVLRKYEPDHVLLRAARAEAATSLTEIRRLSDMLNRVQGKIRRQRLEHISPFAVSIIATIGREFVAGDSIDMRLDDLTADLVAEALADDG